MSPEELIQARRDEALSQIVPVMLADQAESIRLSCLELGFRVDRVVVTLRLDPAHASGWSLEFVAYDVSGVPVMGGDL